jgi:energy-coupling factor transport system substrate-specific component
MKNKNRRLPIREIAVYAMLGAIMFCSRVVMAALPNIHLLGMLTMVYTLVYRRKALYPLYVYVFAEGLFSGFNLWWVPYLYIWTILWGVTMLLPRRMSRRLAAVVYPTVCCLHGLLFGILYAPAYALMYHLNLTEAIGWVIVGIPFDLLHCFGDFAAGLFILPISEALRRFEKQKTT